MKSGIYKITHLDSGRVYVGSTRDLDQRWRAHQSTLSRGRHHSRHLQNAWNKYGATSFEFSVLEKVNREALIEREQFWIDSLQAAVCGYNMMPTAGSCMGCKRSDETRAKISARMMGYSPTKKVREKMSASAKQRGAPKLTKEQHAQGSAKRTGVKRTPEQRERMRLAHIHADRAPVKYSPERIARTVSGRWGENHVPRRVLRGMQPTGQVPGRAGNGRAFEQGPA